ncbi:MAG: hypothetical protein AAFQ19_14265 [Pseudomonadota bacterium]
MNFATTKTPLLIAAMATAVTLTSFGPASAKSYWASAPVEAAQVHEAKFTIKVKKHHSFKHHGAKKHHGLKHHHHGAKKKKHISKSDVRKKLLLKKLF